MLQKSSRRFTILFLVVSLILILLGLERGEMDLVHSKAINICLECIGIG